MRARILMVTTALVAMAAGPIAAERFAIPLSSPGEPVRLEAGLLYGSIHVETHDSNDQIVVEAVADEEEIEIEERTGGLRRIPNRSIGLTIQEERNEVQVSADHRSGRDLRIFVPRNTSVRLSTVNDGDLFVRGVTGDIELNNTNGDVEARNVSGSVVGHSVNGEIVVVLDELTSGKDLSFTTLNGDVDVTLPANVAATFEMRSDNGDIFTDFDVEVAQNPATVEQERKGDRYVVSVERAMRATVNGGGSSTYTFRTFNGDIFIRKGR